MFLNLRTECQRFLSLRTELDAIAQELKQTENRVRRRKLIREARRIALEGNELFWELQNELIKIGLFSREPQG